MFEAKTTKEQMELNTSFTWLIETKLFFFPYFIFIIILLNSEYGDYLKSFYSNIFHFNLIFPFLSKLPNKFKRRKEKRKLWWGLGFVSRYTSFIFFSLLQFLAFYFFHFFTFFISLLYTIISLILNPRRGGGGVSFLFL